MPSPIWKLPMSPPEKHANRMMHLGAAGWEITDGHTIVLLDPFPSRIRYKGKAFGTTDAPTHPGDERPVYGLDDPVYSDVAEIDRRIRGAHYILVSHSHFNHCMDVPYIACKYGAKIIGSSSSANIAAAYGVPDEQIYAVHGGQDYQFPELSVRVIPSLHSPLAGRHYYDGETVPRTVKAPMRLGEFVEGGTYAYLLRMGGREILMFGSMNYIEREIEGLRPDAALVAAGKARLNLYDYTGRLLRALGHPSLVVATHWDVQALPYGASQDEALAQAETFAQEVREVSPRARVVIPRHFETVVLGASE
jgi:L-ascorbate metabolism protein UlaG (beta-lactamase superfamily)